MTLLLENVELSFDGFCVLNRMNLRVDTGEFVCLLGPSGCGKTSTLRVCAGLETPVTGRVLVDDQVMTDGTHVLPPEKRNIGFLFQDFALFPHLNVFDNVAFGLKGYPKSQVKDRVMEVLKQVRMDKFAKSLPHMLSGGQQQRVALARAMAPKPRIILLDEPFSGLDSGLRAEIRDETLHVLKSSNVAAVMVTHDPEEAMFMADRIVLMKDGNIVQDGTPTELYSKPVDHFAASFFGEVNIIKGVVRNNQAETVLGYVPTSGFKDGEKVDVLVRPQNIKIQRIMDEISATEKANIMAARYLGRESLLHICVEDDLGETTHLHARVEGRLLPEENESIMATMDHEQAFVFRAG
ncbi:ABC transporter ATP-binding protein [Terasakiella sp. A23]|uniref:ABC transporter ATP-binding protein n=1 Tax=Terasakiella sp. FCG-A23 TaxID=3080561 RepID=UPI0029539489|nr:ABC transporter ATP-binding protein [Terasakiella sp. A23]MDV7338762.1 ABC transporter ATP-binding protein [Terasakiella sp. A23]